MQMIKALTKCLLQKYNPDLQRRALAQRETRQQDFDDFVTQLKEAARSDKPSKSTCSCTVIAALTTMCSLDRPEGDGPEALFGEDATLERRSSQLHRRGGEATSRDQVELPVIESVCPVLSFRSV
jgi:hypothetical protein